MSRVCPTCNNSFSGEDYCPVDGTLLLKEPPVQSADADAAAEAKGPDQGPEPTATRDEKLNGFMSRLGLRRATAQSDHRSTGSTAPSVLPAELAEQGWRVSGPVSSGSSVDSWPVEHEHGDLGVFNRFRTGALTKDEIYRHLKGKQLPCLVQVLSHGTADFGGARADFELVSRPPSGVRLDRWLIEGAPSEDRAWHLFPRLVELLRKLIASEIRPLVLEPTNLVHTEKASLCLTTAAALTDNGSTEAFHPAFANSSLLPKGWSAPELTDNNLRSINSAVFSLGQILAQATWGQACSLSDLHLGNVPFHSLKHARLARVLMGCLWRSPSSRWTLMDLLRALSCEHAEAMPEVAPWASLVPGASSNAFAFAGSSYWRLEDLMTAATQPHHWGEAISRIEALLEWAESTAWVGRAKLMKEALADGRSADWVLIALSRTVNPDAPLTWRNFDLSDSEAERSLKALAQRALSGTEHDVATLQEFFDADLRGSFAEKASST